MLPQQSGLEEVERERNPEVLTHSSPVASPSDEPAASRGGKSLSSYNQLKTSLSRLGSSELSGSGHCGYTLLNAFQKASLWASLF